MGISSLPERSPVGFLCIFLVSTAYPFSIFKAIARSILHIICFHLFSHSESVQPVVQPSSESHDYDFYLLPSEMFKREFQRQVPPIQFGSVFDSNSSDQECLVCLTRLEHESVINHLRCGHVFHKKCLDKWLDYWNITCPLCRAPLVPEEVNDEELLRRHMHESY